MRLCLQICIFFFQAEDGIRDGRVTGVQTCALPIFSARPTRPIQRASGRSADWVWATRSCCAACAWARSEERRVGKECRCGWLPYSENKKRLNHEFVIKVWV